MTPREKEEIIREVARQVRRDIIREAPRPARQRRRRPPPPPQRTPAEWRRFWLWVGGFWAAAFLAVMIINGGG